MRKNTFIALATVASASMLTIPAFAGSLAAPAAEPVVTPAPVVAAAPAFNWTGAYVGADLGYNHAKPCESGSSGAGGVFAGYNYDFGQWVLGSEVSYNKTHSGVSKGYVSSTSNVKVRGGYDFGRTLVYGTTGYSHAELKDNGGDDGNGWLIGAGVDYAITDHLIAGGEVDYAKYHNEVNDNKLKDTQVVARISYKF